MQQGVDSKSSSEIDACGADWPAIHAGVATGELGAELLADLPFGEDPQCHPANLDILDRSMGNLGVAVLCQGQLCPCVSCNDQPLPFPESLHHGPGPGCPRFLVRWLRPLIAKVVRAWVAHEQLV